MRFHYKIVFSLLDSNAVPVCMWETPPTPNPNYVWETLTPNSKDYRDFIGILKSLH